MKRAEEKTTPLQTLQELDASLTRRQHAEIDLDELNVQLEGEVARLMAQHASAISALADTIQVETQRQLAYLKAHKADFDGPPRSITLSAGTVGYRLGKEHLKPLSKWTWDKVLVDLLNGGHDEFIVRTPAVDREAILAAKGEITLSNYGLKLVQDDNPFIEIKRQDKDAALKAAEGAA